MNLKIKFVLLITLFIGLVINANANEVSKEAWINSMSTILPTAFCQSKQFFRQCYEVTQAECEETAASATRICLGKYKEQIPDVLNQPKDGIYWGKIIGRCAGKAYSITLQEKFKKTKECNDPANWQ